MSDCEEYFYLTNAQIKDSVGIAGGTTPNVAISYRIPTLGDNPSVPYQANDETENTEEEEAYANVIYFTFPDGFLHSTDPHKTCQVLTCRLLEYNEDTEQWTPIDASIHCTFATYHSGWDNFISQANPSYFNPKIYEIPQTATWFMMWFRDPEGYTINLADSSKIRFTCEMLLRWKV